MASHFSWVDFSEEDRQKMMDVVHLFSEHEARDEMGIGTVRDALAEFLFPGTSTIQTRAKYFLFVPWIYRALEQKRVPSAKIGAEARKDEVELIDALLASGDKAGLIGQDRKGDLQRLPSVIYWAGLRSWRIQRYPGSRDQYHRILDFLYRQRRDVVRGEDGETVTDVPLETWHPGLPDPPQGFPKVASMALTANESKYLQERIVTSHPNTLLARLAFSGQTVDCDFPWEHPIVLSLPEQLQSVIAHARNFSEVIYGAALLYNLLLARARSDKEWEVGYASDLAEWAEMIEGRGKELRRWYSERDQFWTCSALRDARIPERTRWFIEEWLGLSLGGSSVESISSSDAAVGLIKSREYMLKRERARLHNRRALDRWGGNAGAFRQDYRWSTVKVILRDILDGLAGGEAGA